MSGPPEQTLVKRLASIARSVAAEDSPFIDGVIIGKNPDGTLIVDDGTGGCALIAPKLNARVGQRIRVGVAPPIANAFNLPPYHLPPNILLPPFPLEGPTTPPVQGGTELPPILPPGAPPAGVSGFDVIAEGVTELRKKSWTSWADAHDAIAADISVEPDSAGAVTQGRMIAKALGETGPPDRWEISRNLMQFRTYVPQGRTVTGVSIRLWIEYSVDIGQDCDGHIVGIYDPPGFPNGPPQLIGTWPFGAGNYSKLGQASLGSAHFTDSDAHYVTIVLSPAAYPQIHRNGATVFGFVVGADLTNTPPALDDPSQFIQADWNEDWVYGNAFGLYGGDPPPVLSVTHA